MHQSNSPRITIIMHRIDRRGGQERSTLENVSRLARQGWDVGLVLMGGIDDWPSELPIRVIRIPGKSIPVQLVKNTWFSIATSALILMKKEDLGLVVTTGTSSWIADVRVIQFCHTAFGKLLRKGLVQAPNPRTVFHRAYQQLFSLWNTWLERRLLPRTKKIIAISNQVASDLHSMQLVTDKNRIEVVHHAPDQIEASKKEHRGPTNILFVGALERKGIDKALRCLSKTKGRAWELIAVGAGDTQRWRHQAGTLGIGGQVQFTGPQPAQPYFQKADLFLFPSIYEPFGLVVSEAVSNNCLPIASSECGAMELWSSRPDWMNLSAFDDDEKWIKALEVLIGDSDQRLALVDQARREFFQWSWDKSASAYAEVLSAECSHVAT